MSSCKHSVASVVVKARAAAEAAHAKVTFPHTELELKKITKVDLE